MNEMTKPPGRRHQGRRPLDHQGRQREAVPVREMRRRSETERRHHPVRPRLVHGGAADIRPAGARPAGFLGDGLVRAPRLRLLVRRHGGLRPLHQGPRQQRADRARRRRLFRRRELYPEAARQAAVPGLRHFVGRAARRVVRATPSRFCRPACARRHGLDRRRLADARRAQEEASRIPAPRIAARSTRLSSIRSSTAIIPAPPKKKSSTRSPTPSSRSTTRCRPAPMSTCARNLPVVDPEKITVPTLIMRGQWDGIASFRRSDGVLRPAAEPGQAFCRDARHFARELPAEELRAGLSHPVELLHPAGADLSGLIGRPARPRKGA